MGLFRRRTIASNYYLQRLLRTITYYLRFRLNEHRIHVTVNCWKLSAQSLIAARRARSDAGRTLSGPPADHRHLVYGHRIRVRARRSWRALSSGYADAVGKHYTLRSTSFLSVRSKCPEARARETPYPAVDLNYRRQKWPFHRHQCERQRGRFRRPPAISWRGHCPCVSRSC
jgi:hypothetical protein